MTRAAVLATLDDYARAYGAKDINSLMSVFDESDEISVIGTGADELCAGGCVLPQSDFKVAYASLAWAYIGKEDHNAAANAFESYLRIIDRPAESITKFRRTCDASGLRAGFLEWLDSLGNDFDSWGAGPARRAPLYAWYNEKDRAFESLEGALQRGSPLVNFVATHFAFDSLRDDPRYAGLLKRIGAKNSREED